MDVRSQNGYKWSRIKPSRAITGIQERSYLVELTVVLKDFVHHSIIYFNLRLLHLLHYLYLSSVPSAKTQRRNLLIQYSSALPACETAAVCRFSNRLCLRTAGKKVNDHYFKTLKVESTFCACSHRFVPLTTPLRGVSAQESSFFSQRTRLIWFLLLLVCSPLNSIRNSVCVQAFIVCYTMPFSWRIKAMRRLFSS